MKLLIIDDEELTRNGLISSISWESLGITEIFQADDGVHGLTAALKQKPEIILCDVRMPRMDGIKMVENLQDLLPNAIVIFMSGYSDKEYLKAAIKLKAVNYIEKPLNPSEVEEAVREGITRYRKNQTALESEAWQMFENSSKLALYLTSPFEKRREQILSLLEQLSLTRLESCFFTTYLIRMGAFDASESEYYRVISMNLNRFLGSYHLAALPLSKHQNYLVFHIYGEKQPGRLDLQEIGDFLYRALAKYGPCFLCRGPSLFGLSQVYHSYETAVILMQSSFFFDPGILLTEELLEQKRLPDPAADFFAHNYELEFEAALSDRSYEGCVSVLDSLFSFFFENTSLLPSQAKDMYYKLFHILMDVGRKMKLPKSEEQELVFDHVEQFPCFHDLHRALEEKTKQFLEATQEQPDINPTILRIQEYISKYYADETLSVKGISEHVYLSAPYVCTLFKNETGQTLNQYITEYRMEKARKLLQDARYKISDISSKVGYSDGNYFGKSFKKAVGLSPSEYREKMMK